MPIRKIHRTRRNRYFRMAIDREQRGIIRGSAGIFRGCTRVLLYSLFGCVCGQFKRDLRRISRTAKMNLSQVIREAGPMGSPAPSFRGRRPSSGAARNEPGGTVMTCGGRKRQAPGPVSGPGAWLSGRRARSTRPSGRAGRAGQYGRDRRCGRLVARPPTSTRDQNRASVSLAVKGEVTPGSTGFVTF